MRRKVAVRGFEKRFGFEKRKNPCHHYDTNASIILSLDKGEEKGEGCTQITQKHDRRRKNSLG